MTLDQRSNHPNTRSYVLKLNRDALPECVAIAGRLENMSSGRCFDFRSGAELLASLAWDLAGGDVRFPSGTADTPEAP